MRSRSVDYPQGTRYLAAVVKQYGRVRIYSKVGELLAVEGILLTINAKLTDKIDLAKEIRIRGSPLPTTIAVCRLVTSARDSIYGGAGSSERRSLRTTRRPTSSSR